MLVEKDKTQLNNAKRVMIGFELGKYAVQISYYRPGMEAPETAEQITGSEVFNIPMVLCKRNGVNQWFYGREALKYHAREGGVLVDHLLQKAVDGECVEVDGERIEGVALLTLFIKRSLSILGGHLLGTLTDLMFTCETVGNEVVNVMAQVAANLQLKNCNVFFQSYAESIYHYMIHQDPELWRDSVLCTYYDGRRIVNYTFRRNPRTTPVVVFVDKSDDYAFPFPQIVTEDAKPAAYARLDSNFEEYMRNELRDSSYSCIYLLGDGFKDEWLDKSIGLLCHNRRLFMGNDVFSRGACYALRDRYEESEVAKSHIFLGDDKMRSNIGLNVLRRGEESYLALLDAGINWYEAKCEYELFLPEDNMLSFIIIPLDGSGHKSHEIELTAVPERDADSFRVKLTMYMSDVNTVKLQIEDLGFGEIYPSSGKVWDYVIEV